MSRAVTVAMVLAALLAACSSEPDVGELAQQAAEDGADGAAGEEPATSEPTASDETADDQAAGGAEDEPPPAPVSDQSCGEPAASLAFDGSVEDQKPEGESVYYCVEVPPGQSSVMFTLGDLADDLELWVAYESYELVVEGGIGIHHSDSGGTEDEQITLEPSPYRGELIGFDTYADVSPGPYWIEISGGASSPFTLTVTGAAA